MSMKIAEALLLRKQLEAKVKQLEPLKMAGDNGIYDQKVERKQISDNVDEIKTTTPRLTVSSITAAYDHYANQLRQLDGKIQESNWATVIDFEHKPYTEKA